MNCENCTMEIIGITCADVNKNPICFDCFLASKLSTDGTIACPSCYGIGMKFNIVTGPEPCLICYGAKRIASADIESFQIPAPNPKETRFVPEVMEIPF